MHPLLSEHDISFKNLLKFKFLHVTSFKTNLDIFFWSIFDDFYDVHMHHKKNINLFSK